MRLPIDFVLFCRNYELTLRGGTPFEKGIEVDAAVGLKGKCRYRYVNLAAAIIDINDY